MGSRRGGELAHRSVREAAGPLLGSTYGVRSKTAKGPCGMTSVRSRCCSSRTENYYTCLLTQVLPRILTASRSSLHSGERVSGCVRVRVASLRKTPGSPSREQEGLYVPPAPPKSIPPYHRGAHHLDQAGVPANRRSSENEHQRNPPGSRAGGSGVADPGIQREARRRWSKLDGARSRSVTRPTGRWSSTPAGTSLESHSPMSQSTR